jgi:capsular polysaccharide transport system permease protein
VPIAVPERSALMVQSDVIWALFLRETKTRFGVYKLGLVWAFVEPLLSTIVIGLMFGFFLQRSVPDIPYPIFVLAGFVPFRLFSNLITSNLQALGANQGLLIYRQVKPLDPLLARVLMETVFYGLAFTGFLLACHAFGLTAEFDRTLDIVLAWSCLVMMGSGLAILFGVLARFFPEVEKIMPIILRLSFFLSCVLYPLTAMPQQSWKYFKLNPLVVVIESIRECLFSGYGTRDLSMGYAFVCSVALLAIGLSVYWINRDALYYTRSGG